MQKPWNCHIYTARPTAQQQPARAVWDFFWQYREYGTPASIWFVRDELNLSYWVMESVDGRNDEVESDVAMRFFREDRLLSKGHHLVLQRLPRHLAPTREIS